MVETFLEERKSFKRRVSGIVLVPLLVVMLTVIFNIQPVKTKSTTIVVPDDYPTIQEAVNAANPGDPVYVRAGTYYEHMVIDKSARARGSMVRVITMTPQPQQTRCAVCDKNTRKTLFRKAVVSIYICSEECFARFFKHKRAIQKALVERDYWIDNHEKRI